MYVYNKKKHCKRENKKVIDDRESSSEMKLGKSNASAGAKMEIGSQRRAGARISTFKRSRSFRVSAKFMCKIRSHANIRRFVDADSKSDLVKWTSADSPDRSAKDREIDRSRYRSSQDEMSSDLRTIVQDVRNKLSITDHRSKRRNREDRSAIDSPKSLDHRTTSGSGNCFTDGGGKNFLLPIDGSYTYENPTFSLNGSFDTSISGCLYPVGNAESAPIVTDLCDNDFGNNDNRKNEPVTIVVGNDYAGSVEKSAAERIDWEKSALCNSTNCRSMEKLSIGLETETSSRSQLLVGRRQSFRFGMSSTIGSKNSGKSIIGRRGSSGLLAIVSTGSKSQTFQGMEFLEGFGKKKHHHNNQSNSLGTNINPLTAQPSLNIHVHALFSAVEHGRLDKARTILESTDVDVNSINSDGLSPLDVAVLNNDRALANMLVAFGAHEGNRFTSPESLGSHLGSLLLTAERRVQELGGTLSGNSIFDAQSGSSRSGFSNSHSSLTGCGDVVEDKQLALWEKRVRALRKMLLGFDQARPPDMSFHVIVDVIGTSSVLLKLQVSDLHDSSIGTKFKVQWSNGDDFTNVRGERESLDIKNGELRIDGLVHAQRYHFRAAVGNIKGWSRYKLSTPAHVSPSSWRDLDGKVPRYSDRLDQLETLFSDIRRPEYTQQTSVLPRRNHKKKTTTIKQLFTASSKFQKNLKRGIFLATLFYHEDKILVTNEDFLPVIEVDETYSPSCMYNDFYWLMKVGCTWEDVKSLRQDMEKCQGSSMNHSKLKLLQAAAQMQTALCVQDLGQIYYKPIRDTHGTVVVSTVNYIKNPKSVSVLNGRWLSLNKVIKKSITQENGNVADILMASIQSQMTYHQLSSIKLTRGLYLGYLKMQSSVDLVHIYVPAKAPNVLPHCKIRDNPHVSAEEWDYLKRITRLPTKDVSQQEVENNENSTIEPADSTEHQRLFVEMVSSTSRRLFSYMNVSMEDSNVHRLYDAEVIELTNQVSMIVIVPPAEIACSAPGTRDDLLHKRDDLLVLPIQVFEMLHLSSYHRKLIDLYSRLSCVLELDIAQAQHNHREAFSSLEVSVTKERLAKLQDIQCRVNTVWKEARWLIDLITFARDRTTSGHHSIQTDGVSMKNLLDHIDKSKNNTCSSSNSSSSSSSSCSSSCSSNGNSLKRSLLQIPPRDPKLVKSSPGRGSWPGPNQSNSSSSSACNLLTNELSKSEQQLPNGGASGQYTRKCTVNVTNYSVESSRAAEGNGNTERFVPMINERSTLSKSEDSLLLTNYKHSPRNRSVNSLTCTTSSSHALNGKQIIYGSTFMGVSTSLNGSWSMPSNKTESDSVHPVNGRDEYTVGNSSGGHAKCKSSKPSASVAAVATPSIDSQLDMKKDDAALMPAPLPGILQVYAAYETGLASGTSLKLHVTPRTTAREVVDLVVKQLNMAVVLKGEEGPIYTADELPNFCLVAVIGARERCLRDDFKPLQLQNPWKKGRLYVRQKQDVLAALEHSSKHTAYL